MTDERHGPVHVRRRAVILSLVFPVVAWFFASWVGLLAGLVAVATWWLLADPGPVAWAVAVACLAAAPFALIVQGLPHTAVVGADFGTRHWLANDLVLAALVWAAFAALIELLALTDRGDRRPWPPSLRLHPRVRARFVVVRTAAEPTETPASADRT